MSVDRAIRFVFEGQTTKRCYFDISVELRLCANLQILQFRGSTTPYLQPPPSGQGQLRCVKDGAGRFDAASTITHDMRAPLRAMQGFATLLQNDPSTPLTPERADYLRRITDAADRMDALIRDSLQYAKIVREHLPLTSIEPEPVLRGILESYPTLQPEYAEIQIVEPLPPVLANATGLGQCFSNLLTNAIKFIKPGITPKIRIWAETRPETSLVSRSTNPPGSQFVPAVHFWFEDNGIGIPPQYQDRIFGMFQQLDKSYEGTGIGLALVRKTAERMEGKVGAESEPGKGSRFWLEFKKVTSSTTR
jgi:signal transduction histidine kinase